MLADVIPPRYEPLQRLGAGGGGEVWAVRDRVTERVLALKVLASDAGEGEVMALVREAVALSGARGARACRASWRSGRCRDSGRRYMVRELVEGQSLEDVLDASGEAPWLEPLAQAADQLTVLHRAGLLHGDVKPANIIVGERGAGTLVDLGLAAPWREGGASRAGAHAEVRRARALRGRAAHRARRGVRARARRSPRRSRGAATSCRDDARIALAKVAARATEDDAAAR